MLDNEKELSKPRNSKSVASVGVVFVNEEKTNSGSLAWTLVWTVACKVFNIWPFFFQVTTIERTMPRTLKKKRRLLQNTLCHCHKMEIKALTLTHLKQVRSQDLFKGGAKHIQQTTQLVVWNQDVPYGQDTLTLHY